MISKEEEKHCKKVLKDLQKRYRAGLKEFRSLRNKRAAKWFSKNIKSKERKDEYIGYDYNILPVYFTSRPDFYYEFDVGMSKLLHDLIRNYYILASSILDLDENGERKHLKKIMRYFESYEHNRDITNFTSPEEFKEYMRKENKKRIKIFKRFGKVFNRLGL